MCVLKRVQESQACASKKRSSQAAETSLFYDDTTQSDLIHFRMHEGGSRASVRGAKRAPPPLSRTTDEISNHLAAA